MLTVLAQSTQKLGQIHFVEKLTQVSDPGPSWPSCLLTIPIPGAIAFYWCNDTHTTFVT